MPVTENQNIELKQSWRDEYLKTICAFANSQGGELWIGVNDNGKATGVGNAGKLIENLPNKINSKLGIFARVSLEDKEGHEIIAIRVASYQVPISYNGKHYIRTGSTTQELHDKELNKFLLDKSGMSWDGLIEERATLEDIDTQTIFQFKNLAKERLPAIADETGVKEILNKLRLLSEGKPRRAALLLFGKDPQRFYTTAYIKVGKFATSTDVIGDDNVEGNLFEQVDAIMKSLKTKYLMTNIRYEGIIRKDELEYPELALREALINSIIHKDYTGAHVQLKIFPEKIILWNEGKLMDGLDINSLKGNHPSVPRNELLAKIFYYAGFIETWGRGTIKIIESCKNAGLPEPVFREAFGGIELTIAKDLYTQEYLENVGLNDRQVKAVYYVKEKEKIINKEYQAINNCSRNTASAELKDLVKKNILNGSDAKGIGSYYTLKK